MIIRSFIFSIYLIASAFVPVSGQSTLFQCETLDGDTFTVEIQILEEVSRHKFNFGDGEREYWNYYTSLDYNDLPARAIDELDNLGMRYHKKLEDCIQFSNTPSFFIWWREHSYGDADYPFTIGFEVRDQDVKQEIEIIYRVLKAVDIE